jgi:DNA-binding response OmpR family regulator
MTCSLQGKRILIVEDEYFIAAELRDALRDRDAEVLGPSGRLEEALSLADETIDAALLDVNLSDANAFAVADRLAERGVPFLLVTGYDEWALPSAYRDVPRITKPFTETAVVAQIEQLLVSGAVS